TLNVTDDRYAIRLAAVENKTSEEQVSDLQLILADLSTKANSQESVALARRVQRKMVGYARLLNAKTRDLGVKASLFYVLLGARMPSILVETSFISNAEEARLLCQAPYQRKLAKAIADAVTEHLNTPVRLVAP
ncbi:MAG TPA: N-acetylmuramoyl-L-alanine amidase, partial [Myxococcota bacterium]|nr:N-acetylmuramoyl-L-alanine amidase [Myxococcota bacterium]